MDKWAKASGLTEGALDWVGLGWVGPGRAGPGPRGRKWTQFTWVKALEGRTHPYSRHSGGRSGETDLPSFQGLRSEEPATAMARCWGGWAGRWGSSLRTLGQPGLAVAALHSLEVAIPRTLMTDSS